MSDSVEWTQAQQDEFTRLYGKLEHSSYYNKDKAHKRLFSEQLPYTEAKSRLEELLHAENHQRHDSGSKTSAAPNKNINLGTVGNAVGLAGIVGSVAAFAAGAYSLGIATMALAGTYLYMGKYKPRLEHPNR